MTNFQYFKHSMKQQWEHMIIGLAFILPRRLVYWCAVRVMTHATHGKYSNQVVPELTALEALERWEK